MLRITATAAAKRFSPAPLSSLRFYASTISDNDPDVIEKEKARNLQKKQHLTSTPHEEVPGWNEYLATTSEAYTKADAHGKSTTIEELQQKTIKYTEARHRAVDSSTGEVEAVDTSETVRRDSDKHLKTDDSDGVSGPLKHASKTGSEETVKADRGEI